MDLLATITHHSFAPKLHHVILSNTNICYLLVLCDLCILRPEQVNYILKYLTNALPKVLSEARPDERSFPLNRSVL